MLLALQQLLLVMLVMLMAVLEEEMVRWRCCM
jgi:hypothetical protein